MVLDPSITVQYVTQARLNELFEQSQYDQQVAAGRVKTIVYKDNPAPLAIPQGGTRSQMIEYIDQNGGRVALVHQYTKSDGSIAASGKPNAKWVFSGGVIYKQGLID